MTIHINWPGYGGRIHAFETHPIGTAFKPLGGVYIFCKARPDGYWDAIYVGETGDFNERLNAALQRHQAWPACCAHGATHIGVMVIGSVLDRAPRLALETELRHTLNPPCNRQAA
jgi:hypothetical protein